MQLSTSLREWTSLLLLHYCVYPPEDTRSLHYSPSSLAMPSFNSKEPSPLSVLQEFSQPKWSNPNESLRGKNVNNAISPSMYPSSFAAFKLPLNPLLQEIITTRPHYYRSIYAGEDPSLLQNSVTNPESTLVSQATPQSPLLQQYPWSGISPVFITHLRNEFNRSQLFAAEACLYDTFHQPPSPHPVSHFTLIQGPPGTGKTKSLVMILNVMQNQQFDAYYERIRGFVNQVVFGTKWRWCDHMTQRNVFFSSLEELNDARVQMKEKLTRPRILVCAPSNAAVNTIIDSIISNGFTDNAGKKWGRRGEVRGRYNPALLRLGSGTSPDHWSVSLEYMVEVCEGATREA